MLDTIKLKYFRTPNTKQLKYWTRRISTSLSGERVSFIYNPEIADSEAMVKYTFFPTGYSGEPLLTLEVSLPKLIFGNNFMMIQSIENAVNIANQKLSIIPHVPTLDLTEGILLRLDMCYNHQVGDAVDDYIKAIGYLDYPHRRTKYHKHEGAEFRSKHKTTKFYNKEIEAGTPAAYGILRQETTILKGANIKKLTGKRKPTLNDITKILVKECLEDDLSKLRLLNNSIANQDTALKELTEKHGSEAAFYYLGILLSNMQKSKKRIAKESNMHPRSIDRKLRNIVDSGIALTLTDRNEPLPPLRII